MVSSLLGLFNLYKPISIEKFTHVISLNYSPSSNPNILLTKDEGEGSERPSKPQSTPSPPHPSEAHVEPQSDLSPGPSPLYLFMIPFVRVLVEILEVTTQAAKIKSLKAQVKKLKKQARPFILHHKAGSQD
ncbi:hypothetical protein Tco_0822363 [Tanacetum coccineum]|uniref:Uncharacterized protein n=1 Tax=Tanacetum coccineum TaxID=301880 RepID=A0ABQ5AJQ9_9ASTR